MNLDDYLNKALELNASDLLFTVGSSVVYRIYTEEIPLTGGQVFSSPGLESLFLPILSKEQKEVLAKEKDLDLAYVSNKGTRFRLNLHYEHNGLAAAFRPIATNIPSLKDLGLPKIVEALSMLPRGLVLVTGPAGNGKSTTQAAMIDIINKTRKKHIITIEDPIEYEHKNIKSIIEQREVGQDTPSFASALKHVLRQSPDVILIGEMRDLETIRTAITAAETGHLVISTLHTNNAVQTIDRIIDVFPAGGQSQIRSQLAFSLGGIIAQQLLPQSDGKGLIPAVEALKANPGIRNLIRKQQLHEIPSLIQLGQKEGMRLMDQSLKDLYKKRIIRKEEALARATDPTTLEKQLAGT